MVGSIMDSIGRDSSQSLFEDDLMPADQTWQNYCHCKLTCHEQAVLFFGAKEKLFVKVLFEHYGGR